MSPPPVRDPARTDAVTDTPSRVARRASSLGLGLRLRLMLTLAAVAIFPIAFVSYVIVRDEVRNVTRTVDFDVHDAAQSAQARFLRLLDRRQLRAVTAASSPRLQTAIRRHDAAALERFARRNDLLLVVDGHTYGQRLDNAATARVQLVRHGAGIGAVVSQLPADAATLRHVSAGAADGVRVAFVRQGSARPARGVTVPIAGNLGIQAYVPGRIKQQRKDAAYLRVAEAGLLALAALMLLTLVLARPLLRTFRWTEEQASEARIDSSRASRTGAPSRRSSPPRSPAPSASRISSRSCCSTSTASRRSTTRSGTRPAT